MVGISPLRSRRTSPTVVRRRRIRPWPSVSPQFKLVSISLAVVVLVCLAASRREGRLEEVFWRKSSTASASGSNNSEDHQHQRHRHHHHQQQQSDNYDGAYSHPHLRSSTNNDAFDVIVVGSGLAGLTTALEVLDRGGRVALVEKETTLGGNSLKASSGINACCFPGDADDESDMRRNESDPDTLEAFEYDTTKSAGIYTSNTNPSISISQSVLIHELVASSASALQWLQTRVGVDLSQVAQLGGHSHPRTHRPSLGMVGAEIIANLEDIVQTYADTNSRSSTTANGEGHLRIFAHTRVMQLLRKNDRRLSGVRVQDTHTNTTRILHAPQVVLATGGFASDRRTNSLLATVRPDLLEYGTTGGSFSTGDGISLAAHVGATTIDLDKIQLHPTGFIDPQHPNDGTKVLAAELLRGVGGLLLNRHGERFCNELGTRDYVTQQMLSQNTVANAPSPTFALVLTKEAAQNAQRHIELYRHKGLLTEVTGVRALASWMSTATTDSGVPTTHVAAYDRLQQTFQDYQSALTTGVDAFGKTVFLGFPAQWTEQEQIEQVFYVGMVTPVLHYCMGGLAIDVGGHVLDENGHEIPGLYAAGEVTGGVHGMNRLGGNSLLECTVYGRRIGQQLSLRRGQAVALPIPAAHQAHKKQRVDQFSFKRTISLEELQQHASKDDLWMVIHGLAYNMTDFAKQHPGGASTLVSLAGMDASAAFDTVHSESLLQRFHQPWQSVVLGRLDVATVTDGIPSPPSRSISHLELQEHSTPDDCWVVFHGLVYDMTEFSKTHKGGAYLIQKYAGKDATDTYKAFHKKEKLAIVAGYCVGVFQAANDWEPS